MSSGEPFAERFPGKKWGVPADGKRFLIAEPMEEPLEPSVRVVVNWYDEFRDREQDKGSKHQETQYIEALPRKGVGISPSHDVPLVGAGLRRTGRVRNRRRARAPAPEAH